MERQSFNAEDQFDAGLDVGAVARSLGRGISDYPASAELVVIGQACRRLTKVASTKIPDDELSIH